jgi:hypothetical protein
VKVFATLGRLRACLVGLAALLLWMGCSVVRVQGQGIPVPGPTASTGPFDSRQDGLYTTAAVDLDGVPMFRVAAPATVTGRQLSAPDRAMLVDAALQQLVASGEHGLPLYDPRTLRVWVHREHDGSTIEAADAHHPVPLQIVTVTSVDARFHHSTIGDVAASWQTTLQGTLGAALLKREPAVERWHILLVARVLFGLATGTALLFFIRASLHRRMKVLADAFKQSEDSLMAESAGHSAGESVHGAEHHQSLAL